MDAPFSGKGLAPHLDLADPERAEACRLVTSLFVNMRSAKKELDAAGHVLGPLLTLVRHDRRAAGPLATMATCLVRGAAYPEALSCIDAVIDLDASEPLGHCESPWHYHSREPMTWPRQRALLSMMRGECRLALGDHEGGEAALAEGAERARASEMPPYFGLTLGVHDPFQGTTEDHRLLALTRAAAAQRLFFEGSDPSPNRKAKKAKGKKGEPGPRPDPELLARARTYLDDALSVVAPRAAEEYAGLVPEPTFEHPALTRAQKEHSWQRRTYFESALVYERMGQLDRAREHLGRAKWIAALLEPTHHYEPELREAVARLGASNTPLG